MSSSRMLFIVSILSWYRADDAIEWVKDSLGLILLEKADLPLIMSILIFMSILEGKLAIVGDCEVVDIVEKNVFANSFIGATI